MDAETLRGVFPAIVTPFSADDRLDEAALTKVTDYVIEGGVHAIMSTGGTGEFPHLDREERKRPPRSSWAKRGVVCPSLPAPPGRARGR
jgi:4-hydroxy-tetrahydrodipicolinate synthase